MEKGLGALLAEPWHTVQVRRGRKTAPLLLKTALADDGSFAVLCLDLRADQDSATRVGSVNTAVWGASVASSEFKRQYDEFNAPLVADDNAAAAAKLTSLGENPAQVGFVWTWTNDEVNSDVGTLALEQHDEGGYLLSWSFAMSRLGPLASAPLAVLSSHVVFPLIAMLSASHRANKRARSLLCEVVDTASFADASPALHTRCTAAVTEECDGIVLGEPSFDEIVESLGSSMYRDLHPAATGAVRSALVTAAAASAAENVVDDEPIGNVSVASLEAPAVASALPSTPFGVGGPAAASTPDTKLNTTWDAELAEQKRRAEDRDFQQKKKKRKRKF